jgi:hypothetical protein
MHKLSFLLQFLSVFVAVSFFLPTAHAATAKPHSVILGSARKAVYMPADAAPAADTPGAVLRIRALMVDGRMKEWTTGDSHDVTDRSFTVRRAVRVNDALPGESAQRWIWQPGPWLLVDRQTGHIALLHLPEYDPAISDVAWFRDYAAYCGVGLSAKSLYAVVARAGTAKAIVQKEIARWQPEQPAQAACAVPVWHRAPIRVSFKPNGHDAVSFEVSGMTAAVLEEAPDNDN